jgi:hypothetical protein
LSLNPAPLAAQKGMVLFIREPASSFNDLELKFFLATIGSAKPEDEEPSPVK